MNPDPLIGQEIDGYHILEELGRGGMGVVYKAEEVALARTVAIKMIARGLAGEEAFAQKFQREARSLARVSSPYITGIYTLRSTEVGLFIVMEYVGGGNLRDRLEGGTISWAEAKPLVLQTLAALHDAHSVGVIHRDIKPGNIMLTERGIVKVTDFGLAKLYEADPTATVTRAISGTLHYMSPEQVQGAQDLDGRTDLYALGVTVYEMLSGRLPFETGGGEFATMRTIVEEDYAPLSRFAKRLPKGLEAIVTRSMAKAPERRFADAEEMRKAFEAIPTDKAPPPPKAKKKSKKKEKAKDKAPAGDRPAVKRETPAAFKAMQAAIKGIPELFKKKPAAPGTITEDGTVVEGDAYVPVKAPRKPLPIRPLLYVFGGGLALAVFALFVWWLLPFLAKSSTALTINSDPSGALVSLNGNPIGETPLELSSSDLESLDSLSQDGARLVVRRTGYVVEDTFLTFTGEPLSVSFVLRREQTAEQSGSFVIDSTPPRSQVFINGELRGMTPLGLDNLGSGPIAVRIERAGYQAWQQANVIPGQNDTLFAQLLPVVIEGESQADRTRRLTEQERQARLDAERARQEQERLEQARLERERLERERLERERLERERNDPDPDPPACDRAALTSQLRHWNEACQSEQNPLARQQHCLQRDRIQDALNRCGQ